MERAAAAAGGGVHRFTALQLTAPTPPTVPTAQVFFKLIEDGNLDGEGFREYLTQLVYPYIIGQQRVHMWDNLRAHMTVPVRMSVAAAGHTWLARPPYTPKWGPIEFVFGVVENHLRKFQFQNVNDQNFPQFISAAIQRATNPASFDNIFIHCGY